jgi:hypothetical protein
VNLKSCWLALSPFDFTSRLSLGFLSHELVDGSLGHPTYLCYFSAKDRIPIKLCSYKRLSRLEPTEATHLAWLPYCPSAFSANVASFFVLSNVQGKAILLGEPARRVWLPSPRTSPRKPEEPFSVLNALGVLLFRAFVLLPRPIHFRRPHHSCTSHENLTASALCFSAFEEPSRIPCNLRV